VAVALADFNGDGKLDVLLNNYVGLQVRLGNGDGTFGTPTNINITPPPSGPAITADFDGDGKTDVAFGTTVYLGKGDGTFRSRVQLRTNGGAFFNAADMDGNGSPDLVYLGYGDDVDVILTRTTADPVASSSITLSSDTAAPQYGPFRSRPPYCSPSMAVAPRSSPSTRRGKQH
jgi:hypothetical protein